MKYIYGDPQKGCEVAWSPYNKTECDYKNGEEGRKMRTRDSVKEGVRKLIRLYITIRPKKRYEYDHITKQV